MSHDTPHSSLSETLQRKLEIYEAYCDKPSQPRAEFRGKRIVPYYEDAHGHEPQTGLSALLLYGNRDKDEWAKPIKRKKLPQFPTRKGGIVGPEMDHSVKARNMPIIFIKQMIDKTRYIQVKGRFIYREILDVLFQADREFHHPSLRPKVGCYPTFNWTDFQVKTWTDFAHKMGIHFSGLTEYSFPKGCLGIARGGSYYPSKTPWPRPGDERKLVPFFFRSGKRSESSRIMRSLKRIAKLEVRPVDFKDVLVKRRIYSRREINRLFYNQTDVKSIREFRESIPYCLSVNIGPPMQVSTIVKRSIRNLATRAKKFEPSLPWFSDVVPSYTRPMLLAPTKAQGERYRRIATLTTANGGQIMNMIGPGPQAFLVDSETQGLIKNPGDKMKVLENLHKWQDRLDDDPDEYQGQTVLGGWFD